MPDVSGALDTAIGAYDDGLNQGAVLTKLQNGDTGFYLGEDGLLRMLPERVISEGMNIPVAYLPTTIVDGAVTSYIQARVEYGIIYPLIEISETDGEEETEDGNEQYVDPGSIS